MSNWSYKSKLSNKCPSGEHEIKINQTPYIGNRKNKSILEMPPLKITNIKYLNDLVLSETLTIPDSYSLKNQIFKDSTGKIIYAIEPDTEKCDFIEKMALINSIPNIKVINYSDKEIKLIINSEIKSAQINNTNIYSSNNEKINDDINKISIYHINK